MLLPELNGNMGTASNVASFGSNALSVRKKYLSKNHEFAWPGGPGTSMTTHECRLCSLSFLPTTSFASALDLGRAFLLKGGILQALKLTSYVASRTVRKQGHCVKCSFIWFKGTVSDEKIFVKKIIALLCLEGQAH